MPKPLAAALVAAAVVSIHARSLPQQTFRAGSNLVPVYVTVTDRDGRLVTTLTRDDFEVRDEGKPQPIAAFDASPRPIQLIVMLDVSGSMSGNLGLLRESSEQLFTRLGPDDVAKVGTFGRDVTISPEFTHDVAALNAALPTEINRDAPTPLWRAVDKAMDSFDRESDRRRVVLVLSDGKDAPGGFTGKFVSQGEIIDRARRDDVMVYAIGMRSRGAAPPAIGGIGRGALSAMLTEDLPDPGLARAAEETGGGYLEVRLRDDLVAAFAEVAEELHSQYLLGFKPPKLDGKKHDIDVRLHPDGMKARARKSYVAPKAG